MEIDLNADLGEGAGFDAELMPLVTSANVCCGLHAGGPSEIAKTLALANKFGVAVGAHPGYADREHFGRRELALSNQDLVSLCIYQLGALYAMTAALNMSVAYVKPHGALYNQACRDRQIAALFVIAAVQLQLPVVGLPGSELEAACHEQVVFIREGFADRRYRPDGSLVPRDQPDAFVHDPHEAVAQVEWLVREKHVQTVCVHGDNPQAIAFATAVRRSLLARGVTLKAFA
ncbi:5-oxoprolinase subunit PxpA [Frigoriglobus tundricola]|uniref:Lactam utilization protein LamB n=1 Tax=Frigoriglobus tundricola TaxID=2774151 RepID=A0A6M5YMW8_9BACT|nr:5-oxoprolinase subunit PxpA [Frigoriglobus tundricola]QJW95305.1 Lactam utilization protein LamB [Frigoriglobus tundricola]